jgi:hypothetical protein
MNQISKNFTLILNEMRIFFVVKNGNSSQVHRQQVNIITIIVVMHRYVVLI